MRNYIRHWHIEPLRRDERPKGQIKRVARILAQIGEIKKEETSIKTARRTMVLAGAAVLAAFATSATAHKLMI